MNATGISGIADGARDIRAVRDLRLTGWDRSPGAAGRASRRDTWIAWIFGIAMDQIGGEPAIRKRRAIGASEDHGAGLAQIVDHGAVAACDDVALQLQAVGGGKHVLVDVYLDGHR